jgi:hypothetical protein
MAHKFSRIILAGEFGERESLASNPRSPSGGVEVGETFAGGKLKKCIGIGVNGFAGRVDTRADRQGHHARNT